MHPPEALLSLYFLISLFLDFFISLFLDFSISWFLLFFIHCCMVKIQNASIESRKQRTKQSQCCHIQSSKASDKQLHQTTKYTCKQTPYRCTDRKIQIFLCFFSAPSKMQGAIYCHFTYIFVQILISFREHPLSFALIIECLCKMQTCTSVKSL